MERATEILSRWSGNFIDEAVLDYEQRRRRRVVLTAEQGTEFLLDLAEVPDLKDGDAIVLETGMVRVRAAEEELLEFTCRNPRHFARLAWHVGNRHLAAEFGLLTIRILRDDVIGDMARHLGAQVRLVHAPFSPEQGAYAPGEGITHHGHGHGGQHG